MNEQWSIRNTSGGPNHGAASGGSHDFHVRTPDRPPSVNSEHHNFARCIDSPDFIDRAVVPERAGRSETDSPQRPGRRCQSCLPVVCEGNSRSDPKNNLGRRRKGCCFPSGPCGRVTGQWRGAGGRGIKRRRPSEFCPNHRLDDANLPRVGFMANARRGQWAPAPADGSVLIYRRQSGRNQLPRMKPVRSSASPASRSSTR